MKRIILAILVIMMISILGCAQKQQLEIQEDGEGDQIGSGLKSISDDMLSDTAEGLPEVEDGCNIILCTSGDKDIHCVDSFDNCADKYDVCRMISCDEELALEPEESQADDTTEEPKTGLKDLSEYNAREPTTRFEDKSCEEKQHTCYYKTQAVNTETHLIDSTLMALTCQGDFVDCTAKFGYCECGLLMESCELDDHLCFKGTEEKLCEASFVTCMKKYDECLCGKKYGCDKTSHKCYVNGKDTICRGDYEECMTRFDKCECGNPNSGCTEVKHICYNSVQTTTTYKEPETEICEGWYDDCSVNYDHCMCGTEEPEDYSCPLIHHTCKGGIVCVGTYDECQERHGSCDCGISADERDLL